MVVCCKEGFFNIVFGGFLGHVLGFVWRFCGVLGVSVHVDISEGNASVLAASVMPMCGGSGRTER